MCLQRLAERVGQYLRILQSLGYKGWNNPYANEIV